jgi:hypothetical protein
MPTIKIGCIVDGSDDKDFSILGRFLLNISLIIAKNFWSLSKE